MGRSGLYRSLVVYNPPEKNGAKGGSWREQSAKLTALDINRVQRRGYYGDGGGLYLQINSAGARSWVFRFKQDPGDRYGARDEGDRADLDAEAGNGQLLPKLSKVAKAARAAKGRGEHHAAMPFDDVPAFIAKLRQREAVSARAQ